MPLVGGGGAGNVGGGSAAGVGTSLNYIGNHVYANSGTISVPTAETTLIDGSTANNSYVLAGIQLGCIDKVSDDFDLSVKINGEIIMGIQLDNTNQEYSYGMYPITLVIPPNSRLEVTLTNISQDVGRDWYAILTGEVYA